MIRQSFSDINERKLTIPFSIGALRPLLTDAIEHCRELCHVNGLRRGWRHLLRCDSIYIVEMTNWKLGHFEILHRVNGWTQQDGNCERWSVRSRTDGDIDGRVCIRWLNERGKNIGEQVHKQSNYYYKVNTKRVSCIYISGIWRSSSIRKVKVNSQWKNRTSIQISDSIPMSPKSQ